MIDGAELYEISFRCFAAFWGGSDASLEFCAAFLCCFAGVVLESLFVKVAMELFCVKKECHSPCKSTVTLKRNDLHHAS